MDKELTAAQIMSPDVHSVPSSMSLIELERFLIEHRFGEVPVIDDGRLVGVISRSDLVKHLTADQAAESIDTNYFWDLGGRRRSIPTYTAARRPEARSWSRCSRTWRSPT